MNYAEVYWSMMDRMYPHEKYLLKFKQLRKELGDEEE